MLSQTPPQRLKLTARTSNGKSFPRRAIKCHHRLAKGLSTRAPALGEDDHEDDLGDHAWVSDEDEWAMEFMESDEDALSSDEDVPQS
jgi:hypothetical protein